MLEPWNDSSLLAPPVHTTPSDSITDAKHLTYTCNNIIRVLSKQSPLHRESAIASRIQYKYDKKFRNDIGYRYFKKVNTALKKYLTLNLLKDVENFLAILPSDDDEYMPTRQMLEYVLVRMITFSKLMQRVCVCSKQASVFYMDRIKRGESHWMSLIPYALLSRIWSMSFVLLEHTCNWYLKLYPFLIKLTPKGLNFLPKNYELPTDLYEWLDMRNIDDHGKFKWSQKIQIYVDPSLEEKDNYDTIIEYVNLINNGEESLEEKTEVEIQDVLKESDQIKVELKSEDRGEVIARNMFKSFFNPTPAITNLHAAERVTNKNSLEEFLNVEERFRNEENDKSLSSHLSFMQWQALKTSLLKLLDSLSNNRKIERKFQKIWKEKCLDYK